MWVLVVDVMKELLAMFCLWMTKVSSTNPSHRQGVWGRAKSLDLKLFHKQVDDEGANGGTHGSPLNLFIILTLEEEVCVCEAEVQ